MGAETWGDTYRCGEHEPPVDFVNVLESRAENEAEEYAESGPHLPHHDEPTPELCGHCLRGVDGNGGTGVGVSASGSAATSGDGLE